MSDKTYKLDIELSARSKPIIYKVNENGCHICTSHYVRGDGYVIVRINNKNVRLHRHMYELTYGKIGDNLVVMHKCDNPSCMNPEHLELGTHKENMEDKVKKDRTHKSQVRLTQEQKLELCSLSSSEEDLAKMFGVSYRTVRNIRKRYREGCERL